MERSTSRCVRTVPEPHADTDTVKPLWYRLESRGKGSVKKGTTVSGEVQLRFALADSSDASATPEDLLKKLAATIGLKAEDEEDDEDDDDLSRLESQDLDDDDDPDGLNDDTTDEADDASKPEKLEKRKKKLRLRRLRRKTMSKSYEFSGGSDVVGIVFLDINRITDLPPERNGEHGARSFASMLMLSSH